MGRVWRPTTAEQTAEAVRQAASEGASLDLVGAGSRRALGRPIQAEATLDLSGLSGVVLYEPEELVLTALPGTPLAEIEALLASRGQRLGFEPPDLGPLWGGPAGRGTLGGAAMTGLGGPRRLTAGGPRDHCLGVRAINGLGEAWASGGRVVKNVTGFDLPKLMCGAFGALGPVTELTFKATPAPGRSLTVVLQDLDPAAAAAAMIRAMASPVQVAAAAHLPADVVADLADAPGAGALTLLRVDGMGASAVARARSLAAELGAPPTPPLETDHTVALWRQLTDVTPFARDLDRPVWRLSVPPAVGTGLGAELARDLGGRWFVDWAGGAVWLELPQAPDAHAASVRRAMRAATGAESGQALLIRAPDEVRRVTAPLEPLADGLATLTWRIKRQFDPKGLFNPGRMYGDL